MYFILIPFVALGLASKIKSNKYKEKIFFHTLHLDNTTWHGYLNKGNLKNVFYERQNAQEEGFIR